MSEAQVFLLRCPCGAPIVLPRQSPLGKYEGQQYQATDKWPLVFVCTACGQQSVHEAPTHPETLDDSLSQVLTTKTLWQVEIECVQESCGQRMTLYTIAGEDDDELDIAHNVRAIVPPTHVHLDQTGAFGKLVWPTSAV